MKQSVASASCVLIQGPFNTRMKIFLPFHIPKLVKSLPFYIPEAWKRYPFRAEPPRIGHYRGYPPGVCIRFRQNILQIWQFWTFSINSVKSCLTVFTSVRHFIKFQANHLNRARFDWLTFTNRRLSIVHTSNRSLPTWKSWWKSWRE